jgi:type IV pilus assembly protein PilW
MKSRFTRHSRQNGLTLIEFMIAITLGLIVLAALVAVFTNSSRARAELEKSNRMVSSGRSALELMNEDLRMAGYMAEFDTTPLSSPATLPDNTSNGICTTDVAELKNAMMLHVQGINNATASVLPCLSDIKAGTDIVVVRRASACTTADSTCQTGPFIQASLCSAPATGVSNIELAFVPANNADYAAHYFLLDSTTGAMTLHKNNCSTLNEVHRYLVHIYFVANNHETGDGIPTLKRAELRGSAFVITPMVEGVDNMQMEYGIDAGSTGVASSVASDPGTVDLWRRVVEARVHLLMRNTDPSAGFIDTHAYKLGDVSVAASNDTYKRHVYSTTVRFAGPAWRRAP